MKSKLLAQTGAERTFILVLDEGEEALATITAFAKQERIGAASLSAIGAFTRGVVGWFDFAARAYRDIPVEEQCEVLSLIGDIAVGDDGAPSLHAHVVLGLKDGSTRGGHLLEGVTHPTLEVVLVETPVHLRRRKHPALGIALIEF